MERKRSAGKGKVTDLPVRKVEQDKAELVKGGGIKVPQRNIQPCL
jgi:hypothetical protein